MTTKKSEHNVSEQQLINKAISESYQLSLNAGKYQLSTVLSHVKSIGQLTDFPNMVKLNKHIPGIILLNCGGMPIFKFPYTEPKEKKPKKVKKDSTLF